jgi:hypothetical protein
MITETQSSIESIQKRAKTLLGAWNSARNCGDRKIGAQIMGNSYRELNSMLLANMPSVIAAHNSNALDTQLSRQAFLLRAFKTEFVQRILQLSVFCARYNDVPLEGSDRLEVAFLPLQTTASTSFVSGTGYTNTSDFVQNTREVLIGGDGASGSSGVNAAANTAKDRLFQQLAVRSYDINRLPALELQGLFDMATRRLAVDIETQVISRVVTAGNFGAATKTLLASACTADDVADLEKTGNDLNWPVTERALVLDSAYRRSLVKDSGFRDYIANGPTDPSSRRRCQQFYGFDQILPVPNMANYSPANENLVGFITHKSAVLVATSPIMPSPAVMAQLFDYSIVSDPVLGISLESRRYGNATLDQGYWVIECSFGAAKGIDSALKRITSA